MSPWTDLDVGKMLERLTARGVDFVVIGGIAVVLLGSPRVTQDLDICFARDRENLEALGKVLVELEGRLRNIDEDVSFVPDARTLAGVELLTLSTAAGNLDVHVRPKGAPPYQTLRRRARRLSLEGFAVLVASIEDMIAMKLAAGRTQDLADVEELEAIRRLRKRIGPPEDQPET
jgi:predicted nucleotidyltransferase